MSAIGTATSPDPNRRVRRHPRYTCNFPVSVTLLAGEHYRHFDAHCKNLSKGGMGILLAEELSMGEVVTLSFALSGSAQQWEIRAILRHRRGYHYGVEFVSIPPELSRTMRRFLKEPQTSE
jgi:c-di-GMP-binding flagellar brake protein YcgR